jgi:hypothetical protein
MAECSNCRIGVGCSCNLTNGLCKTCYSASKNNPSFKLTKKTPCTMTLPRLNTLLNQLNTKPKNKTNSYQIAIVRSQIAQFSANPCKFESIISNIQL